MKFLLALILAQIVTVSAFGVLRRDAIIYNATGVEIEVLYPDGDLNARIRSGGSHQIIYPAETAVLPIRFGQQLYRYPCKTPPPRFMKASMFKTTFKLVIADDRRLYLIPIETPPAEAPAAAYEQPQPDGWPIEGVPVSEPTGEQTGPGR